MDFDHDRSCAFNNGTDLRNIPIAPPSDWHISPSFSNERSNIHLPTAALQETGSPLEVQDEVTSYSFTLIFLSNSVCLCVGLNSPKITGRRNKNHSIGYHFLSYFLTDEINR